MRSIGDSPAPTPRRIIPPLGAVYDALSPLALPMIRVTAGLLLLPHGCQNCSAGSAAKAWRAPPTNLRRALEAGGASLKSVAKVTIFLTDMSNFKEVVELRRKFFSAPYPADTIVEVKAFYTPDAMIEVEAIAAVPFEEEG